MSTRGTRDEGRSQAESVSSIIAVLAAPPDVHLWLAHLSDGEAELEQCRSLLAPDEQSVAGRFKSSELAARYTFARAILRLLLGHYLQCTPQSIRLECNPSGKPHVCLPQTNLAFNLSHSADLAAYAFTRDVELGVDLERIKPLDDLMSLAGRFFHPQEFADLQALPEHDRPAAFFTCWTRKEAYLKARGHGLSEALDSFRVSLTPQTPVPLVDASGANLTASWTLRSFASIPGYQAAVCHAGQPRNLRHRSLMSPAQFLQVSELAP